MTQALTKSSLSVVASAVDRFIVNVFDWYEQSRECLPDREMEKRCAEILAEHNWNSDEFEDVIVARTSERWVHFRQIASFLRSNRARFENILFWKCVCGEPLMQDCPELDDDFRRNVRQVLHQCSDGKEHICVAATRRPNWDVRIKRA